MKLRDAELHAQGASQFTDDLLHPEGTLAVYPAVSSIARGIIEKIDTEPAFAHVGVIAVFTAADIPGVNQIGNFSADEVLLAEKEVVYLGQPIALVVAETGEIARQAAASVVVDYQSLPAVFDARTADKMGLHIAPRRLFSCGDVEAAWAGCDLIVEGSAVTGAQEHMYLETQNAIAYPLENNGLRVFSATQSPGGTQRSIARVLGLPMHAVEVDVVRLGGGFGGKEEQATAFAVMAALASHHLQRIVKISLRRDEDYRLTGKRHPYEADFKIGLDRSGKILAYRADFFQNAGAIADLSPPILERSLFHAGNSYFIPNMQVSAVSCRTNLPPNTAFRGFGGPQAMYVLESAIFKAADKMGVDASRIQEVNLLREGQHFYYGMQARRCMATACWREAQSRFALQQRQLEIDAFNAAHKLEKKGIAIMPICFGISFTSTFLNQADALLHVYGDGSVSVSCGAVEMGQGVKQKIGQVVSVVFGIDEQRVKVESTNTTRIANMSPTAASTGADLNGQAARLAALQIKQRLIDLAAARLGGVDASEITFEREQVCRQGQPTELSWNRLVSLAYLSRTALSAEVHYATPELFFDRTKEQGQPFAYHVYGCAAVEVTLDCLRGRYRIDSVKVVHDDGQPLDVMVDCGQIEGGIVQGLGWMTLEEVLFDDSGRLLTDNLTAYKIPDMHFAPDIDVHFLASATNPPGLMHSKAVGEPPLMYGIAAYFALCKAIRAFIPAWQPDFRAPMTPEKVLLALYQKQHPDA
ncbi:molybdopterin cofactor-binding domain-containing protein [Methylomicrobium sp. Wu6]|uniref:xanthine dehydrogenase molybdopterin binding subunit n=1 Tax=Methylomicrobium sp. Wu6 TaxID=3107928 RepID=UPI002DD62FF2|nr:molybdopterin cofactor-binding domain-containing protein [Methylomicrobium sp. Wu6]MEC4749276.1 molybdopterin cofactor-binding domain-containing protein [Methylomicrobium sp. Wu6]